MPLEELVVRAKERSDQRLAYAGEVTPEEAWETLKEEANSVLVDVRTPPEWAFVGGPKLTELNKRTVQLPWRMFPSFEVNAKFQEQFDALDLPKDTPIFFICRTGGRSLDAAVAMSESGYEKSFNVMGGFEGDVSESGHRGETNGWKAAQLPWEQA